MIRWQNGWTAFEAKDKEPLFLNELQREIQGNPRHALSNRRLAIIGFIPGQDDLLLACDDFTEYAYVHLTWNEEQDPECPHVEFFEDERGVNQFVTLWDQE